MNIGRSCAARSGTAASGKQKLACRLVAMADAAGDDVIQEDEQLHERREAAAAVKAATAERRRALHRTRWRLQAVAMEDGHCRREL